MNAISSALSGLHTAFDRIDRDAADVARSSAASADRPAPPVDTVDIASSLVDLASAKTDAEANVKVIKTVDDVRKRALDLFA